VSSVLTRDVVVVVVVVALCVVLVANCTLNLWKGSGPNVYGCKDFCYWLAA